MSLEENQIDKKPETLFFIHVSASSRHENEQVLWWG